MIEQLRQDINKIRRRLSLKFLLISYFGCTLFNMFFGKYMELGLVLSVIGTLAWVIKNVESEYNKIMDAVAKYRESDNFFVIGGLISVRDCKVNCVTTYFLIN